MIPSSSAALQPAQTETIVESLMPVFEDSTKTRYLGYRASGFSVREATKLCEIHERTVRRWREDDLEFREWDQKITPLRQELGAQYAMAEFLKNFRLVMQKDQMVLTKSIIDAGALTKHEQDYLKAIRPNYSPQQLMAVRDALLGKEADPTKLNFTQLVLNLSRGNMIVEAPR